MNQPHPPSFPARVALTFAAPRRLFAGFRDQAPWFDVLLVCTLIAGVAAATQPAEVFLEQMEDPVNRRGRPVTITSGPAEIVRYGRYLALLSALVGHPIVAFALAGLLTLIFSVLGGGSAGFRQHLSVVAHALLIPAAGTLVVLALSTLAGQPVALTVATLVPFVQPDGFAHALLARLDLFHLWTLAVLALGVEALDPRHRWGVAAAILGGTYVLVSALLAAG